MSYITNKVFKKVPNNKYENNIKIMISLYITTNQSINYMIIFSINLRQPK